MISLDNAPDSNPISIDSGTNSPALGPDEARQRATDAHFALSGIMPTKDYDSIYNQISRGGEGDLRTEAASILDQRNTNRSYQLAQDALSKGDVQGVKDALRISSSQTNPDTVLEERHARQYMAASINTDKTDLKDGLTNSPEQSNQLMEQGIDKITKDRLLDNESINTQSVIKNMSMGGYVGDIAKSFIPGRDDIALRGIVEGTNKLTGGLLGNNLEEQAIRLYNLPTDKVVDILKKAREGLDPLQYSRWLQAMRYRSDSDQITNNIGTIMDIASMPGVGKVASVVKGMAKSTLTKELPEVAAKAAAGDLAGAGEAKANANIVSQIKGVADPQQVSKEQLPTILKNTGDRIGKADAGNFGQEDANRLQEEWLQNSDTFLKTIQNTAHVERIPDIAVIPKFNQQLRESMKAKYKFDNVLDVHDPILDPLTKTYNVPIHLGQSDATYWSSFDQAKAWAKDQGLSDAEIKGINPDAVNLPPPGQVPPVKEGFTRFYHGGPPEGMEPPTTGGGRWTSTDYKYAQDYRSSEGKPGKVWYVDIPKGDATEVSARMWDDIDERVGTNAVGRYANIEVPEHWAKQMKPMEGKYVRFISGEKYVDIPKGDPAEQAARSNMFGDLGGKDVEYFTNPDIPEHWAKQLKDIPTDGPWYIRINRPLDTTAPFIRDAYATTDATKSPNSWLNTLAGNLRTSEETQSAMEMANRKVGEYAQSKFIEMFKDFGDPIRALSKDELTLFERATEHWKKTGKWLDGPSQIEQFYSQNFGRIASPKEVKAYYAYRFTEEAKTTLRDINNYKAAHGRGAISINVYHPEQLDVKGNRVETGWINAIPLDKVPWGEGGVIHMSDVYGQEKIYHQGRTENPNITKSINEKVKTGQLKAYRIDDPDSHPFNGFGSIKMEGRPQVVVAKNVDQRNLSFRSSKGKPDIEHEYPFYAAQADMKSEGDHRWYTGDNIALGHHNKVALQDQINVLDKIRDRLLNKDTVGAKEAAKSIGIPWEDILKKFRSGRDSETGKFTRPAFNLTEPFKVVSKDQMLIDTPGNGIIDRVPGGASNFKDATREGSPVRQSHYNLLSTRRDLEDIIGLKNIGTRSNPQFESSPVKYVDPLTTMNRSLRTMVNSLFMDDSKSFAMENWLAEARPYMTEAGKKSSMSSPSWAFKNSQANWMSGMDPGLRQTFENRKMSIQQFIGIPSSMDNSLNNIAQRLADSIYTRVNPDSMGPVSRNIVLAPTWALMHLTDGANFVRSMVYHTKMGMFNPVHLFLWHMNYSSVIGIAGPQKAFAGGLGSIFHKWAEWNKSPEVLDHMDLLASRMGAFQPGDWKLFNQGLDYTGFANMHHSFSMLPSSVSNNMFTSKGAQFLDAGQVFIKTADRNLRQGAWYTASKEWREANPTGKPSNRDWIMIQNRADMLVGNMTNASKSNLQRGLMAPATQFTSYTLRMWEMMTGRRLDWTQKARLLGTTMALYGIPGGGGFLTGPLPGGDFIRKWATDNGYLPNDNIVVSTLMEGLISEGIHLATGKDFNIGQRFGQYGIFSEDLLRDKGWWDVLGGATYSTMSDAFSSLHPFYNMVQSFIKGDGQFTPQWDHFKNVVKNISTYNIIDRGIQAVSTGNWLSRNGSVLKEGVDPWQAIFQSATGTIPRELADVQTMNWSLEVWEKNWKAAERAFVPEFQRGLQAMSDNNPDQANEFFNNARYYLDNVSYPIARYPDILKRATDSMADVVTRARWEYYSVDRNLPQNQELKK